jgi:hypothetical protein
MTYARPAAIGTERIVRSSQMTIKCQIFIGIPVASTQGIEAEKNKIDETETMPTTNRPALGISVDWIAGKNISASPLDKAPEISAGFGN